MKFRALPWPRRDGGAGLPVHGADLRQRSVSGSKQFVVFSTDVRLRQRVASYAEELTGDVLQLLGEG